MPRFYFHIANGQDLFPDEKGCDLTDLAAAHRCAVEIMHYTMHFDPEEEDWRGWTIRVADLDGRTLLTLLYPAGEPIPRQTFGKRRRFSPMQPVGLVAGAILLGLGPNPAAAEASFTCVELPHSITCVAHSRNGSGLPGMVRMPEEVAALPSERERKWIERCQPAIRQDRYGVGRYQYAAPGCEFGKSED